MRSSNGRRRRMLHPSVLQLESWRLLAVQASTVAYDGTDLTGPTAAPGPDGTQDLHFQLTNLPVESVNGGPQPTIINWLTITWPAPTAQYPSGFTWIYGSPGAHTVANPTAGNDANPLAGPGVQVILESLNQSSTTETADVYFSPVVQQIDSSGKTSDATLPPNSPLSVSVKYTENNNNGTYEIDTPTSDQSLNINAGATQVGTTGLAPADNPPALPSLNDAGYPATFEGQSPSTNPAINEYAAIKIDGLKSGATLSTSTLSDEAGLEWGAGQSYGRGELGINWQPTYSSYSSGGQSYTSATLYFPPYRDEAGTTMTLTYQLTGSSTEYISDVAVPPGDHTYPALRNPSAISQTPLLVYPTTTQNMVTYTDSSGQDHTVDIQALLDLRGYPVTLRHRKILSVQEVRRTHQRRSIPRCVSPTPAI